jgi:hypothetical protein
VRSCSTPPGTSSTGVAEVEPADDAASVDGSGVFGASCLVGNQVCVVKLVA